MCTRNLIAAAVILFAAGSMTQATGAGTINVNTNMAGVPFTLTGPSDYTGVGFSWSVNTAPAGSYTISYGFAAGYTTPPSETRDLPDGASITFNGNYSMPGATGMINVITDIAGANFTLSGAGNYTGNGTFWSQSNAPAGLYNITFGAVPGYPTPPSQSLVLSPGRTITFSGMYGSSPLTGTINVTTDMTAATFTIIGPASFYGNGSFWTQANAPAGAYTITYGAVPGYVTPPSQTLVLSPGLSITFMGSYRTAINTGTITVSTNLTAAAFTLTGPATYSGGGTFWSRANCPAGVYTIYYLPVPGYPTPANQTLVLSEGGVISFSAVYGGSAASGTINVNTNLAGASFVLSGPTSYAGNGTAWLQASAPIGTYTITFGPLFGYTTPAPQIQTLVTGGTITFNGIYVPVGSTTGSIIVSTDLAVANFSLSGPAYYNGSGTLWLQSNAPPGSYTITFGPVAGFVTPPNQTLILSAGGTITFAANYGPPPPTGKIIVNTNLAAATFTLVGPTIYSGSGMLWSTTNCPPGSYTITFSGVPGYPTPPNQTLIVSAAGTITFTGTYGPGPASGTINVATNMLTASFWVVGPVLFNGTGMRWSQSGLPAGSYTITYGVIAGYEPPASQTLYLAPGATINFTGNYTSLTPFEFILNPSSLSFVYELGQPPPAAQRLSITPQGLPIGLTAYPSAGATWLSVTPSTATAPVSLTVTVNAAGLPAGVYSASIMLAAQPDYRLTSVPVILTVRESPRLILTPASMSFSYAVNGSLPKAQDLYVSAAVRNVSFSLVGNTGRWLSLASSGTTPARVSIMVDPTTLGPGTYSGTVVVSSTEASNSPLNLPVTLVVTGLTPQFTGAGIFNAASHDMAVAPCSIATIYGTALAQSTASAPQAPLPVTLGGARVKVNGRAAPLFDVSPTQIDLQMPCDLAPGSVQVEVNNGSMSAFTTIHVNPTGPGVFLYEAKWASAINQDGTTHGDEHPATPGSIVSVFFTGQGLLDEWIAAGQAAPMDQMMYPIAPVSVTLAGQPVETPFVGLSPGSVGLAQANIRIPNLPSGEYPLVITVGGVPSNVAVLCIDYMPANAGGAQ